MIVWLGNASFRIGGDLQIYIDPCLLKKGMPAADVILVTHRHAHHFSLEDIRRIMKPSTHILCNTGVFSALEELAPRAVPVETFGKRTLRGIAFETIPAYTLHDARHPREDGGMGFLFSVEGTRIYHAGDSDLVPEMRQVSCDVALLPVSGGSVMTAGEASHAAAAIKPGLAIPMHYGMYEGTIADAQLFCTRCIQQGIPAKILTPP